MTATVPDQAALDAIVKLAEEIALSAPECTGKAMQIIDLVRDLRLDPDRETIQDTIDAETLDSDLTDIRSKTTASAVVKALRDK